MMLNGFACLVYHSQLQHASLNMRKCKCYFRGPMGREQTIPKFYDTFISYLELSIHWYSFNFKFKYGFGAT